jgi:molybdenum cofactor biosynthesis enzyme MoaA
LGGREILLTGGEPFLAPDLGAVVEAAARWAPVTILTNAMVLDRGSRRRTLESLDPARVTMQVASTPLPLITVVAVMRATLNDPERDRAAALNTFRCT